MEQSKTEEAIIAGLTNSTNLIITLLEPNGIISPNLSQVVLVHLESARKNLLTNG